MADTVEQIVRRLRGLCPLAPPLTALEWVQEASNKINDSRPWSHLRAEGQIAIAASRSGTVTATQGNAVVQGVGLVFVAGDAGRQFRVTTGPPYTILSVDTGLNRATLDQPYRSPSVAATAGTVLDAYITMPENFGRFIAVLDPPNNRRLHVWTTDEELNFYDPQRSITGTPRAIVSRRFSTFPATEGRIQYELVPYQLNVYNYPFFYIKRPPALSLASTFSGVLRDRPDIFLKGALLECVRWPGVGISADKVNPYTRLSDNVKAGMLAEFEFMLAQLEARDEEIYLTWLETVKLDNYPYWSWQGLAGDYRSTDASGQVMVF